MRSYKSLPSDAPSASALINLGWKPIAGNTTALEIVAPHIVSGPNGRLPMPDAHEAWQRGPLRAIRGHEGGRWHLSVSHRERIPSWREIGEVRDALLPKDVWLCVPHPPREYWMNIHPNVLHLWEIRDVRLIEQWREEGEMARAAGVGTPSGGTDEGGRFRLPG